MGDGHWNKGHPVDKKQHTTLVTRTRFTPGKISPSISLTIAGKELSPSETIASYSWVGSNPSGSPSVTRTPGKTWTVTSHSQNLPWSLVNFGIPCRVTQAPVISITVVVSGGFKRPFKLQYRPAAGFILGQIFSRLRCWMAFGSDGYIYPKHILNIEY